MKILTLKFKIIIGVVLFIVLIGSAYCSTIFHSSSPQENITYEEVGKIEYKGKFLMPVENFKVVTSKYGSRIHPISRKTEFSFWY